jgi:hypothetical protein
MSFCIYTHCTKPTDAQSYSKMRLTFMKAIPDGRIGLMIMIPVCWWQYQKVRLIIVHDEDKSGFISDSLLIYTAGQKTGDNHNQIYRKIYARRLKVKLISNVLRENSASNSSSIVACLLAAADTCLPRRCLVMAASTHFTIPAFQPWFHGIIELHSNHRHSLLP